MKRTIVINMASLLLASASALAQTIGIHFTGDGGNGIGDNSGAASLAPTDVAGAPGFAQGNWNNCYQSGQTTSLTDSTGASQTLNVQWSAYGALTAGSSLNLGTPDGRLMGGMIETDWGFGPASTNYSGETSVGGLQGNQMPAVFLGGLQAWMVSQNAVGYNVVQYVEGYTGWWVESEHWIKSASGNALNNTMVVGPDITPHFYTLDVGQFGGTYGQAPLSATNVANPAAFVNYEVFPYLTNDVILACSSETASSWQTCMLMGLQIVPIYSNSTPLIISAPAFSPQNNVYAGSPVSLGVMASGFQLQYQWQTDGGSGGALTNLPNATNATLAIVPPELGVTYNVQYDVVIYNAFGASITSSIAPLTVNPAVPPSIVADTTPASYVGYVGGTVTFAVSLDGNTPMTNQWQLNNGAATINVGSKIISLTPSLTLTNLHLSDAGSYFVASTNAIGGITSTPATLTVLPAPGVPVPTDPYAYAVYTNHPIAYWRLNETADTSANTVEAYDSSGHNLDGIYQSRVADGNPGPQPSEFSGLEADNTCASFPGGANGAISLPALNLNTNTITITAWIYPTTTEPANAGILFFRTTLDAAGLNFLSSLDGNGDQELGYTWNNNGNTYGFQTGLYPPQNEWSFVALRITPTEATFYLCYADENSTNLLTTNSVIALTPESFTGGTILLGGDSQNTLRNYIGQMDEVAVFGRALSDDQIVSLYTAGQNVGSAPVILAQPTGVAGFPQALTLTADGTGAPYPAYQWQAGTGGVFHNLADGADFTGTATGNLQISRNELNSLDYQLVIANSYGSATSSVATVTLTPIPTNGIWTVNFSPIIPNNFAPSTNYQGYGIIGNGTYWNAFAPAGESASGYAEDGVTPSGITINVLGDGGNWFGFYPMDNPLLDPFCNYVTGVLFTNVPNGTYNLAIYSCNGWWHAVDSIFTVNGVSQALNNVQDSLFVAGDNTVVFENVAVTNGGLLVPVAPVDPASSTQTAFNGAQLQLVSLSDNPVTLTATPGAGGLTLSWTNYGVLLSATNIAGPWITVPGATSPFVVNPTKAAGFFRVLVH